MCMKGSAHINERCHRREASRIAHITINTKDAIEIFQRDASVGSGVSPYIAEQRRPQQEYTFPNNWQE